jgi:hypothetical protein
MVHSTSVISLNLIVAAAAVTAVAVVVAALAVGWTVRSAMTAAIGSFAALIAWRSVANALSLNADFMPAISVGDCGCLVAGGAIPYLLARSASKDRAHPYLPAVVGAIVGFVVNVVIL